MNTNLLKDKLESIKEEAKTATEKRKKQLREQYRVIQQHIKTLEGSKEDFEDIIIRKVF